MAALSRRDIEMIFRAETDKATRPIADLGKAVKAARSELTGLVGQVDVTEASFDKLGATTRDLKKAQDELGTARALLTQLNAQEKALETAQEKAAAAAVKYEQLKDAVAAAEQPSKRLVNSMEAAGRATAAAGEKLEIVQREAAQTREQITAIIGPVDNVGDAFRTIANTSQEIARGLAVAGQAADDFGQKMRAAATASADAAAKQNADTSFQQSGQSAGLLQSQIDYISQFENRVELLAQAKRELASQNAAFDQALTAQEAKTGAANVANLRREITETFAAAERAEQVTAFRQVAADAKAAVSDVSRFGVSQDVAAESSERLAVALGRILNPANAASRTLDSIDATLTGANAALTATRPSAQALGEALNELGSAGAGIRAIANDIDNFKAQSLALGQATATFDKARADALGLAQALATVDAPTEEMARELKRAEANVETAGQAMQRQGEIAEAMGAKLRRAGVDVNNLALTEQRLAAQATQAAGAATEIAARGKGKGGFLGLSPTDATNLSYQINDIFTQLASGQSIFITLAQQGPQIWQIEGVKTFLGTIKGLLIPLAAVAAGFGTVALAAAGVYKATSPDANTQAGAAYLTMLGEKSEVTAAQFGKMANALEDFGLKSEEARKIATQFISEGLNPSYIGEYTQAIKDAADATGVDLADASNVLSAALSGGYDEVVKLNEQFPVLTDAELAQVSAMMDSGREDEARQLIFDRYTSKMADAAAQMNGPWSNAWTNLKGAAAGFGDYVANVLSGVLAGLRTRLDEAAVGVNYLLLRMRGLSAAEAGNAAVNNQGRAPTPQGTGRVRATPRTTAAGARAADDAEREAKAKGSTATAEDRITAARIRARRANQGKGYGAADMARLERIAVGEEQEKLDTEAARRAAKAGRAGKTAANKARAAREKAAREAATEAKRIDTAGDQLEAALDTMAAKVAKVSIGTIETQLAAAVGGVDREYARLYRQLEDFSKLTGGKGLIGGKTIEQYRQVLDANKLILSNQAQLKVFEENLNDTINERKSLLAAIEEKRQRGDITGAEAIRQTAEVTSRFQPLISKLAASAIAFAKQIGGATPSPELLAFIAKMEAVQGASAGENNQANRKAAETSLGGDESRLNDILAARNSLVEQYNTLQQLGLLTADEARKKSAAAYAESQKAIQAQIALVRATLEAAMASMDPQAYQAMIEKLKAIEAQTQYLDPRFAQLKQGVDGIISQNVVNGFDRIAQAMAGLATGGMSVGDALQEAGLALLDFIGQTIGMIAKLILQMLVLDAVQKITGIPVGALLGAMNGGNGGGGGGGFSLFGLKLFHGGGTVGGGAGQQRTNRISISPAALAAAPRYHEGTPSVGLKPQEQIAVVEKGEKIMTERQQELERQDKARTTGGGRGLRQVLAFGDDQVAAAMAGGAGEDVTLTHVRRNVPLIKQLLQD